MLVTACVMQPAAPSEKSGASAPAGPTSGAASSGSKPTSAPAAQPGPLPTGPVEIVFWGNTSPTLMEYHQQLVKEYQAKHPNITVQADFVSFTDLSKKLLVSLGTGTGPDIFLANTGWLPPFVEKDQLAPISPQTLGFSTLDEMKAAYQPGTLDPLIRDGNLLALPYDVKSLSLYINTEHFRAAGLDPEKDYPNTWDETLAVAKKLTKVENGKITRQGFRWILISPIWTQNAFEPLIHQFGGDTLTADGKCAMNSPAGVKAMELLASFSREKAMDPSVTLATAPVPTEDFAKEQASMIVALPQGIDFIQTSNPGMKERNTIKVVPLPQIDASKPVTLYQANTYAINKATSPEKVAVAQDFMRFLVERPVDYLVKASAAISPVKAVESTPEFKNYPYMDVMLTDIRRGQIATWSKYSPDLVNSMHRAVESVLLNGAEPKQALDTACQEVTRAMGS